MAEWQFPTHHRDPLDDLLIARAITEDATFNSEDSSISRANGDLLRRALTAKGCYV